MIYLQYHQEILKLEKNKVKIFREFYEPLEQIGNMPWQGEYSLERHLFPYYVAHNHSCYKVEILILNNKFCELRSEYKLICTIFIYLN